MEKLPKKNLGQGFYTVAEAARLIRVGSTQRIYGWLKGYHGREVSPLIVRDFPPLNGVQELSFLDLMEVRFVEHFREQGVKVRSLRIASDKLRREFSTNHPFALDKVHLVADKVDILVDEIFKESAVEASDRKLRSLLTNNYVMYEAIKQVLLPGITFDRASHLANSWVPRPEEFPNVKINPTIAYGQPVIPSGVPTSTIFSSWNSEKQNIEAVSYWYGIPTTEALEAIRFEQSLEARGEAIAA